MYQTEVLNIDMQMTITAADRSHHLSQESVTHVNIPAIHMNSFKLNKCHLIPHSLLKQEATLHAAAVQDLVEG